MRAEESIVAGMPQSEMWEQRARVCCKGSMDAFPCCVVRVRPKQRAMIETWKFSDTTYINQGGACGPRHTKTQRKTSFRRHTIGRKVTCPSEQECGLFLHEYPARYHKLVPIFYRKLSELYKYLLAAEKHGKGRGADALCKTGACSCSFGQLATYR